MAVSKNNVITHGLSGTVGDTIVFSQRAGKTVVSNVADRSRVVTTPKQKAQRRKFQEAVIYAKVAIHDPATKEAYESHAKEGKTAFNVAVADLLHAPDIEQIDLGHYNGQVGDKITITAVDDFMVKSVTVIIYLADGTLAEQGAAVLSTDGLHWIYTATTLIGNISGSKITVQATDIPDNMTESTVTHA